MSEESAQLGSQHFAKHHGRYDLAIIGEPTSLKTVFRHKGCLWADVHTTGVAVHGATPHLGVNAIVKMAKLVSALDTEFREILAEVGGVDEWLGASTINLGMIQGARAVTSSQTPANCAWTFAPRRDYSVPVGRWHC